MAALTFKHIHVWTLDSGAHHRLPDPIGNIGGFLTFDGPYITFLDYAMGRLLLYQHDALSHHAIIDRNGRYTTDADGHFPRQSSSGGRVALPLSESVEVLAAKTGEVVDAFSSKNTSAVALSHDATRLAVERVLLYEQSKLAGRLRAMHLDDLEAIHEHVVPVLAGISLGGFGAGGTEQSFVINKGTVHKDLSNALEKTRKSHLECSFSLPDADTLGTGKAHDLSTAFTLPFHFSTGVDLILSRKRSCRWNSGAENAMPRTIVA